MLLHRLQQQLGFGGRLEMKKRVADPDAAAILPDRFRIVVGAPGEVPGPFQGERDFHAVVETHVVLPDAQHVIAFRQPMGVKGHDASCRDRHAPRHAPDAATPGPGRGAGLIVVRGPGSGEAPAVLHDRQPTPHQFCGCAGT